jgi:hypothetical protein
VFQFQLRSQPTIDFVVTEGPEKLMGKSANGVPKFDGDRLTIRVAPSGRDTRPVAFKTGGDESYLFELQR